MAPSADRVLPARRRVGGHGRPLHGRRGARQRLRGGAYRDVLTPLVEEYDCALLLFHHERKGGASGDRSEAAMGARQWVDQADAQLSLARTGKYEENSNADGGVATRRPFALRRPKLRIPTVDTPEHFEVRGRKAANGALTDLALEHPKTTSTVESIVAACDRPLGTWALAEAADLHRTGTGFRNGLKKAVEDGLLVKNDDDLYERAAA